MKIKRFLMGMMVILLAMLGGLYLISCGDDDDGGDKKEFVNNGGQNNDGNNNSDNNNGGNNGGEKIDVPQELLGGWQRTDPETNTRDIYFFYEDGTGKIYLGVDPYDNIVQGIRDFTYSYNRQNSTLTLFGESWVLAFQNGNSKMTLSFDGEVLTFYAYNGTTPGTEQDPTTPGTEQDPSTPGTEQNPSTPSSEQKPSTPTGVKATVDGSSISVSWQSVSGANSYNIYRSSSANGSYSFIGTSSTTSYRDSSPISGYNYYKVSAVNSSGESSQSSYVSCNYTIGGGSSTAPNAPTGVTVSNEGNASIPSIRISWSSVSNATSYKVYRSSSANGSYSQIGSPTSETYLYDNNPMSGNNYYKVKAVNSSGESSYSSSAVYNNNPELSPCPPTVKVSGTTLQTVTWTNSTSAGCGKPTSYEVYKENPYTGKFELQKTTTSTSYSPSSSDIHPGINMYAIKAINNTGSDIGYALSQEAPLAKPSSFTAQKQGSDIKFTWSKVTWATGYQIFMSTSANGTYGIATQVDDGDKTSCTYYYPASSGTYYFKIRAIHQSKLVSFSYSDQTTYKSVKF